MTHPWRQKLHLEPPTGWMNDPNGLCWFQDRCHVFFQFCPDSAAGHGQKQWGHFSGKDLLHWRFHGTALWPDTAADRDGVYSGCAVVQTNAMHLFYTGNVKLPGAHDYIRSGRYANVIHTKSTDGLHFSPKQILLRNADYPDFCSCHVRDPKVWQEEGKWQMLLGARTQNDTGCALWYRGDTLTDWRYHGTLHADARFGYMWECPDSFILEGRRFFCVCPQGLPHAESRFQNIYQAGWFPMPWAMETPLAVSAFHEWDLGFDFYAPQSFRMPDSRRLLIGWMGLPDAPYENPTTALGWQHCLTLPRELTVDTEGKLLQAPMRELLTLREAGQCLPASKPVLLEPPFDLEAACTDSFRITFAEHLTLAYVAETGYCTLTFSDGKLGGGRTQRTAYLPACENLRLVCDTSSVECYLQNGACVLSTRFYPATGAIPVCASGCTATIFPLQSMEVIFDGT